MSLSEHLNKTTFEQNGRVFTSRTRSGQRVYDGQITTQDLSQYALKTDMNNSGSKYHVFRWRDMVMTLRQSGWNHQQWASPMYGIIDTTTGQVHGRYGGHQMDWYPGQHKIRIWGPAGYEGEAYSNGSVNGTVVHPGGTFNFSDYGTANFSDVWNAWMGPEQWYMARNNSGVIEALAALESS